MQIEELMRRRVGMTLGEKITEHAKKIVTKNVISHINDSFYAPYEEDGQIYYLRRTNLQRDDGRTLNIIDEIEVEEQKSLAVAREEEQKDMSFDEFMKLFEGHIDGTAENERSAHES